MNRIGIFGGTFDPIHNGHLAMAQIAREEMQLNRIVFVPSHFPPHKSSKGVVPAVDRLKMVKLAIQGNAYFRVTDFEVNRSGRSYSIDTLKHFQNKFKKSRLYFIIGGDAYAILNKWKSIKSILKIAEFIVVNRPGYMQKSGLIKCHHVIMPGIDISSSYVRQRLKEKKEVRYWVPGPVADYIKKNKLYQKH